MSSARRALVTSIASAAMMMAAAGPALAFHHVGVPANVCGQSDFAGGANPGAAIAHPPRRCRARVRLHHRRRDRPTTGGRNDWTVVSVKNDWNTIYPPSRRTSP